MDYSEYHFSWMERIKLILLSFGVTAVISWLFYRSFWGMCIMPFLLFLFQKREKRGCIEAQKKELHGQFVDFLKVVSTSLMAGMSMENAWREAARELEFMHGTSCVLYPEVKEINRLVENSVPMESVLIDFAYRSGVGDIISFGEVFEYGKRSGGDWRKIIEDTTFRMEEKYETEKEIEVMLAGKRMEQKVMSVIPLVMIAFLQVSSGDYMDVLYGNPIGICCMSICLLVYGIALYLAEKIMKIQV